MLTSLWVFGSQPHSSSQASLPGTESQGRCPRRCGRTPRTYCTAAPPRSLHPADRAGPWRTEPRSTHRSAQKASAQGPCAFVSASAAFTGLLLSERGCEPACFLPAVLRGALLYGQVRLQGIVTLVLLSTFLIYFHWDFFIRKLCETGLISEFRNIHPLAACPAQADSPDGRRRCWSSLRTLTPPGLRSGAYPGRPPCASPQLCKSLFWLTQDPRQNLSSSCATEELCPRVSVFIPHHVYMTLD